MEGVDATKNLSIHTGGTLGKATESARSVADQVLINLKNAGVTEPSKHPEYIAALSRQVVSDKILGNGHLSVKASIDTTKNQIS